MSATPEWPERPPGLTAPTAAWRREHLGAFAFEPAPTPDNPEAIRITDGWAARNVVRVEVPELAGVRGAGTGRVWWHKDYVENLRGLFAAWRAAGLMGHVLTWGGSFAPRFIRGSRTRLSAHSWASAFDINAAWNPLGKRPALAGEKGSVRELVPLAVEHGFYWGGWYAGRPDGMHVELCRSRAMAEQAELESTDDAL